MNEKKEQEHYVTPAELVRLLIKTALLRTQIRDLEAVLSEARVVLPSKEKKKKGGYPHE